MEVNPVAESWAGEFSDLRQADPAQEWAEDFHGNRVLGALSLFQATNRSCQ